LEIAVIFLNSTPVLRGFAPSREKKNWSTRRREGAKWALVLLPLFSTPAVAQDVETDQQEIVIADRLAPIIVTANGSPIYPEETGQAITEVRLTDLERLQSTSVADILARTPGITVSRNGGPGKTTAVRIRGAEGEQTLTLIDGVRVNDPSSPGGAFDFGNLLVGNIARIEVLRGPNSVPWGSQAIGGVVNIVTAGPSGDFGGSARAEVGYKNNRQLVGTVGINQGRVRASLGGGYFKDDGISVFKDGTERDGYRQYAANGKIDADLSDTFGIDLRAYYANSKTHLDGFPPPFFGFSDTDEFSKAKEFFGYSGIRLSLLNGDLSNRLAFTLSDINRDDISAFASTSRGRVERFEYQGDASIADEIRSVFGVERETSRLSDGFSRFKTGVTSGYVQIIAKPFDRFTLTGGARIDDHRDYGTTTTFSANAAWQPTYNTTIRGSYGEGFKAPTLYQLNSFYGNPALTPEAAKSYDLGIEQRLIDDTLTLGVTAFLRNTTSQIGFDFSAARPNGFYNNTDRTRARGIETVIRARPSDKLTLEANYSLIDSKNRSTGEPLLRRPKHSVNASLDWDARNWLKLGADLHSVSKSRDFDFVTFNPIALEGYTLVGLRAAVPIGDTFEFYGRIENLFDVGYETVSGYGTLGRNAHVGVRAKF
jgi:vitamin B12 transporter